MEKKGEDLKFNAKGSKDLAGGRHLIAAIAYGKGVFLKEAYEKMDGRFLAQFFGNILILRSPDLAPKGTGNGFSSWTMTPVNGPMWQRGPLRIWRLNCSRYLRVCRISTSLNLFFHLLRTDLEDEAISKTITSETFEQFRDHVLRTLERLPIDVIVRTIESMKDRIEAIILFKGYRTNY